MTQPNLVPIVRALITAADNAARVCSDRFAGGRMLTPHAEALTIWHATKDAIRAAEAALAMIEDPPPPTPERACPQCGGRLYGEHGPRGTYSETCTEPGCDYEGFST